MHILRINNCSNVPTNKQTTGVLDSRNIKASGPVGIIKDTGNDDDDEDYDNDNYENDFDDEDEVDNFKVIHSLIFLNTYDY
jgi:hypothetical protein